MTLIEALERAGPDSLGIRRAFGGKDESTYQWRATAAVDSAIEIQVRSSRDWMWVTVAMILPSEGRWVDPEIVWWPS